MPKAWLPSEILKLRIIECGTTYREMAEKTGLHLPTLWRFVNGKGGLSMANVDKLFTLFGLRVIETRPKRGRKGVQSRAKKG